MQKYDPLTFILDIGGSYEMLTRKFGGTFFQMRMDSSGFRINPFALPNTFANRQFLFSFVQVLIASDGYRMPSRDVTDLAARIDELQECPTGARRLSSLARMLRKEPREQLHKWVAGGQFGALFDNADDTLELSSFQTFEFAGMDEYPSLIEPLLFYVLYRITNAVENPAILAKLKVGVIDEAWKFFRQKTTRDYIVAAVKTWPKHNGSMIIATQSSADLSQDEDLAKIVIETCHTKYFLTNPGMDRAIYRELFGLNETETDRIARLIPKREMLMKRPDGANVLTLEVDAKSRWLYATDPMSVARRRDAIETHGFESGLELLAKEG
ncbi:MAG: hypothetical protein M3Y27_10375 [Acidobacteriota bacterium]|nr:hypothetical protein [Acidobacteriota bacterium]